EQVEIEVGQERREPIKGVDLDLPLGGACAHAIARRPARQTAPKQAPVMKALEVAFLPPPVDHWHFLGLRGEEAHYGHVAFEMRAEIAEWVGVTALDDGIGFRTEGAHWNARSERERMRSVPVRGTRSQSGRCANSYSIS